RSTSVAPNISVSSVREQGFAGAYFLHSPVVVGNFGPQQGAGPRVLLDFRVTRPCGRNTRGAGKVRRGRQLSTLIFRSSRAVVFGLFRPDSSVHAAWHRPGMYSL